jgi:UDP-glucose 4-epimerase
MKKYILVTGGAGHVGSSLVEELLKDSNNVVMSLDNYYNGSTDNHIPGAKYYKGHTKDVAKLLPNIQIDQIYHLGEYARISPSFEDINVVFEMNILGTQRLLDYAVRKGVGKFIYAASSTRFADSGKGKNQNPYSFTKATNVELVINYKKWYGLNYAICYFYNAFGPREKGLGKYATLIAKFENLYLKSEPLTVVKPGTQKRNFTYVKDLARGIVMVGNTGEGDGYALYNEKSHTILEIAEAFGGDIRLVSGYPGREDSGMSPKKAREELGWGVTVDILDYIHDFVKAYPRVVGARKSK